MHDWGGVASDALVDDFRTAKSAVATPHSEAVRASARLDHLPLQEPIVMDSTAVDNLTPPRCVAGKRFSLPVSASTTLLKVALRRGWG
jgi:hypothetical protein